MTQKLLEIQKKGYGLECCMKLWKLFIVVEAYIAKMLLV